MIWTEAGPVWPEASVGPCVAGQDQDFDKIPDEVEGCNKVDTDGDGIPNYADTDSDGDKVPDKVEGTKDSDGDKTPNYVDTDSDNDGVKDGNEDLNGDGKLGCCLNTCNEKRDGCTLQKDGCGKGQKCSGGKCSPATHFLCSNGESDPLKKITFPGSGNDNTLPTFICHPPGETSSKGLKQLQFKADGLGQWKVAIEKSSNYGAFKITGAGSKEAGACFDLKGNTQAVAGFILSMPAPGGDLVSIVSGLMSKVNSLPGKASVAQVSSGVQKTSQDGYQTVVSTQMAIKMAGSKNPPAVRNALVGVLLGKPVSGLPAATFGPSTGAHTLKFSTLLRKDNRIIVMGAVATTTMANDSKVLTGIHLDDLSNGTGLATHTDTDTVECDTFILTGNPVADIIWVVDESGSMNDNRNDVANNAKDFFNRAIKSGLDFRMAVTGVDQNHNGKFCSSMSTNSHDPGGVDRFLLPTEQAIFEACVKNPPGYEGGSEYGLKAARDAVNNHLPRQANSPNKIRTNATLVVIHATDEIDQGTKSGGVPGYYNWYRKCPIDTGVQNSIKNFVKNDINLFKQHGAIVHLIGGVCNNSCNAEIGHDYNEVVKATKGISADVCQNNLGSTLQVIINTITGTASTAKLEYVPISASLAVAVGKTQLQRSRTHGFDYAPTSNSLLFIGVTNPQGSQIVASYRRYKKQVGVIE